MFRPLMLAMALASLLPWFQTAAPPDPVETRLPVALVVDASAPAAAQAGFDTTAIAGRVVQGAADQLSARGFAMRPGQNGEFVVAPSPGYLYGTPGQGVIANSRLLTLSVAFSGSSIRQASGTETRFGGLGDEPWRLAYQLQRHLTGGMRDVLAYRSFDRGVLEQDNAGTLPGRPQGLQKGGPWVTAYPLYATNPTERSMLQSQGVLDLLSSALANAVADYFSPGTSTPLRDPGYGWRQYEPWKPLPPRLLLEADRSSKVALTFDAASYPPLQPSIVDLLRDSGVRCTMFLTGDFVDRYPELVVQMVRDGHEIANHSDAHPDMPSMPSPEIVADLEAFDAKIVALTGRSTRPWFRPPSGAYNDRVVEVAAQQGYYTIYWTADSADWRPDVDSATVRERLLRYAQPGAILVQHLTSPQSAEVLPDVLRILKARGIEFGTISEMLGKLE